MLVPGDNVSYPRLAVSWSSFRHGRSPRLESSSDSLASVGAIDLSVDRAVVVPDGVYPGKGKDDISSFFWQQWESPVISLRKSGSGSRPRLLLPPHEILQLAKLIPQVGVGGGDGLRDRGVEVDDPRLGGRTQVSIACVVLLVIIQIELRTDPWERWRSCPRTLPSGWEECYGCKDQETSWHWQYQW